MSSFETYFAASNDKGQTFDPALNLSNNSGFSDFPQIVVASSG